MLNLDDEILILCALSLEAEPIIETLSLKQEDSPLPKRFNTRYFVKPEVGVRLITLGRCDVHNVERIGSLPAALVAWEALRIRRPKLLINAGTAGGFIHKGARIGEVFLSKGHVYYHGRHFGSARYKHYAVGKFLCFNLQGIANDTGAQLGIMSSSDSVLAPPEDLEKMKNLETDAKDMEAAAIAEVCCLNEVPFIAVKAITDFIDSPLSTVEQFRQNYRLATENLANVTMKLVNALRADNHVGGYKAQ